MAVEEEHRWAEAHQSRLNFLTGLVSAVVAGTVAGILRAEGWFDYAALCSGPIIIIGLTALARRVPDQYYKRFLKAVAMRAKLEQRIGLTSSLPEPSVTGDSAYWATEPIVAAHHLESRRKFAKSEDWLSQNLGKGYNRVSRRLLGFGFTIGVVLLIALLGMITVRRDAPWRAGAKTAGDVAPITRAEHRPEQPQPHNIRDAARGRIVNAQR
jgi:hypothetical protein